MRDTGPPTPSWRRGRSPAAAHATRRRRAHARSRRAADAGRTHHRIGPREPAAGDRGPGMPTGSPPTDSRTRRATREQHGPRALRSESSAALASICALRPTAGTAPTPRAGTVAGSCTSIATATAGSMRRAGAASRAPAVPVSASSPTDPSRTTCRSPPSAMRGCSMRVADGDVHGLPHAPVRAQGRAREQRTRAHREDPRPVRRMTRESRSLPCPRLIA